MTKDKHIRRLISQIVKKIIEGYCPERIILFGSYAYGRTDPDSDIDLLIIKETDERPIDRRVAVSNIVYDPQLHIPFEPIVITPDELKRRTEMGNQFINEILMKGKVIYEA